MTVFRGAQFSTFLFLFLLTLTPVSASDLPTVAVSQIVAHPSLDAVRQGVQDALNDAGFKNGSTMTWIYQNANGNISTSTQIAQNLASLKPSPKVIVAIGTPTAQSALAVTRHHPIPVVFAAVTDPVSSRLVKDVKHPHGPITGIIDFPPIADQLKFMSTLVKDLKTIGVLYNPGESNSVTVIEKFTHLAQKQGLKVILSPITKTPDLSPAAKKLIDQKVDAIYVPQDNTIVAAMPSLASIGRQYKCPIFTSDNGSVKDGALAALSYSYYDIGRKAGDYIVKILQGEDVKSLPITSPNTPKIYINEKTRLALNLNIDQKLLDQAEIYEGPQPQTN